MKTTTISSVLALALVAVLLIAPTPGCGDDGPATPRDSGAADSGGNTDGSVPRFDNGLLFEAGITPDNGIAPDSGVTPDNGIAPDSGVTPDSGSTADSGSGHDSAASADLPGASTYQVVVTEFLADPMQVNDANGEWLELYNAGSTQLDLAGWTLADQGTNSHVIQGQLLIDPGQYLVLGRDANSATNGGVQLDYTYADYNLANADDEIMLLDDTGKLVDLVAYDKTPWNLTTGASLQLRDPALDNGAAANWCVAQAAWSGSAGDKGTPGAANDCASSVDAGSDSATADAGVDATVDAAVDVGVDAAAVDAGADAGTDS